MILIILILHYTTTLIHLHRIYRVKCDRKLMNMVKYVNYSEKGNP
jgi:hypothetical protein